MFRVTNVSNNSLPCSDKQRLAPGDSRRLKTLGEKEEKYKSLGWFSIYEEVKEEPKQAADKMTEGKK